MRDGGVGDDVRRARETGGATREPGAGPAPSRGARIARAACVALASYLSALWAVMFARLTAQVRGGGGDVLAALDPADPLVAAVVAVPLCALLLAFFSRRAAPLRRLLFRLRVPIGLLAVVALTALEISGSSIAQWSTLIGGDADQGTLLGFSRSIRGDEFMVLTPFAFSQEHTGYAAVSDLIRGTATDVTMVYAQPCWALPTLFRPFLWGYLVLGSARGLAFFWSARLVALLLVSFELGRLFTRDRRCVSAAYAAMLAFCPLAQWWFAINGIAELLIFGQALVLALHRCLREGRPLVRAGLALLMAWLALGYLFVVYPAWQVPLFWMFLALGAGDAVGYLRELGPSERRGVALRRLALPLCGMLLVVAAVGAACLLPVTDVIALETGTVYPGQRSDLGGGGLEYFLYEAASPFNALRASEAPLNASESAGVFALFPLGLVFAVLCQVRRARRTVSLDAPIVLLGAVEVLLAAYCLVGLPEPLAAATLLSHSLNVRVAQVVCLADLLLMVRSVALWDVAPATGGAHLAVRGCGRPWPRALPWAAALAADALAGVALALVAHGSAGLAPLFSALLGLFAATLLASAQLAAAGADAGAALVAASLVVLVSGASVNPVQRGADALLASPARAAVAQLADDDPGALWAGEYSFLGQLCITAGAPCVNSVNTYPALDRWRVLDPDGSDERAYNRYAHITVVPVEGPSSFVRDEWDPQDTFTVRLGLDDMERLGIDYYVSLAQDLPEVTGGEGLRLELVSRAGGVSIWRLVGERGVR